MPEQPSEKSALLRGGSTTLILAVLQDGARHGYDIAREVERRSGNALSFTEGTLYPTLHTLEKNGLIASEWERVVGERGRRVYRLTTRGEGELARLIENWESFSRAMNFVIGVKPGTRPDERTTG